MLIRKCDICQGEIQEDPAYTYTLKHGAELIEIRTGVNKFFQGDTCLNCLRDLLKLIAEKGIFVGRKITLPEQVPVRIQEIKEKVSWRLRDK